MRCRPVLLAGLALLVAAPQAFAAPKAQISDAKGDYPVPVGDIASVTFSTIPKGSKEALQIDMLLAGPPSTQTPYSYTVTFTADDCEFAAIHYGHPLEGVFSTSGVGCRDGSTSLPEGSFKVTGSHVIFTVPLSKKIKRGSILEDLAAETAAGGAVSGGVAGNTGDTASSDKTWKVGSDRPKKK